MPKLYNANKLQKMSEFTGYITVPPGSVQYTKMDFTK
jgi:hypothetical protein